MSPYRQWRAGAQYTGTLDPTLRVYGTADYLHRYYPEGSSAGFATPYSEDSTTLTGSVQKELVSRTLLLSAGGSYSKVTGLVDSDAWSLDAAMSYRIGKLEIAAGVDVYSAGTLGVGGGRNDRDHQYYFIKIRRRIL